MLMAKKLRKLTSSYKDPETYKGILSTLETHALSGMGNTCLRYKGTKEQKKLSDYASKALKKEGFKVWHKIREDGKIELDVEW